METSFLPAAHDNPIQRLLLIRDKSKWLHSDQDLHLYKSIYIYCTPFSQKGNNIEAFSKTT